MTKIVWISDLDLIGSGYKNLSVPLCEGLAEKNHDVKVIGLGYKGQEHNHNISIIPVDNLREAVAAAVNLANMWQFSSLCAAVDLPLQEILMNELRIPQSPFSYVGIIPIESTPLSMSGSFIISAMKKCLIISEFGTNEAKRVGLTNVDNVPIGIDTNAWRMPSPKEKQDIRKAFNIQDDEFVVLTIADNQERKNLSAAFSIISKVSKATKTRYILVTREHNRVGWNINDLANEYKVADKLLKFERGLDFPVLWSIYAAADAFLLPSKCEGLGLPLLEAMAMGIPCVAGDNTGMRELLSDHRGFLIPSEYDGYRDPFGNSYRWFIHKQKAARALISISENRPLQMIDDAYQYVRQRTWNKAITILENHLLEIENEQKEKTSQAS